MTRAGDDEQSSAIENGQEERRPMIQEPPEPDLGDDLDADAASAQDLDDVIGHTDRFHHSRRLGLSNLFRHGVLLFTGVPAQRGIRPFPSEDTELMRDPPTPR